MDEMELLDDLANLVKDKLEESKRQEAEEGNQGFVQLYEDYMPTFREIIRVNPTAAEIFYFVMEHMDRSNSLACSYAVLQEATGRKKTTVWNAVKYLKEKKYLNVSKMGNCNVYHVNANIAWKSWSNGKKYAKFRATIVLSESEQTDSVEVSTSKRASVKEDFLDE